MIRSSLAVALLLALTAAAGGDDKEKSEKLRKEIADLRAQVAAKESELAKLEPATMVKFLHFKTMKVNDAGRFGGDLGFGSLEVQDILDENSAIFSWHGNSSAERILITSFNTNGLVEGKVIDCPVLRVLGTKKIRTRTYHHLEPYTPPKK